METLEKYEKVKILAHWVARCIAGSMEKMGFALVMSGRVYSFAQAQRTHVVVLSRVSRRQGSVRGAQSACRKGRLPVRYGAAWIIRTRIVYYRGRKSHTAVETSLRVAA